MLVEHPIVAERPLLTVIVLTIGRPNLEACIQSVRTQAGPRQVELLVVGDTHAGTFAASLGRVPALCLREDARWLRFDGGQHAYGCPQRTYGQRRARGHWLAYLQDDSQWLPGAWDAIQESIFTDSPCPRLFRVATWQPGRPVGDELCTIWQDEQLVEGNIDGDGIVTPNRPDQLAPWPATHYASDFDAIAATCKLWRDRYRWEPFVLSTGTPHRSGEV